MKPASLGSEYEDALATFRDGFGVLHYFVFEAGARGGLELHRDASLAAFEALRPEVEGGSFRLTQHRDRMSAVEISVERFIGSAKTGAGTVRTPGEFLEAKRSALAAGRGFSSGLRGCYLRAFADPPYSLQLAASEAQRVFETVNEHLFGGFEDDLEILSWSTDWSNFFDAGHEWWGAFWWTVHNRSRGLVAVLAASTTD